MQGAGVAGNRQGQPPTLDTSNSSLNMYSTTTVSGEMMEPSVSTEKRYMSESMSLIRPMASTSGVLTGMGRPALAALVCVSLNLSTRLVRNLSGCTATRMRTITMSSTLFA